MSYILDALNKSDKEQNPELPPDINKYAGVDSVNRSGLSRLVSSFLIVLVAVNLIFIAYFWQSGNTSNEAAEDELRTEAKQLQRQDRVITPLPRPNQLVRLATMPINVQNKVAQLNFSSHIYSEYSDLRAVNINGERFTEMEMVTSDLQLEQITPDGVIFGFQEQRFEVDVLNDWPDS